MNDAGLHAATDRTSAAITAPAWTERERLEALAAYDIMGSLPETAFDDIAQIAARTCNAPIALVSFLGEHSQWFKSVVGLGIKETPREISFCAHAILQKGLFVVPDATADARFSCNPLVTGKLHTRFYAGAVLRMANGIPLGTVCVLDRVTRPDGLTAAQADTLEALARSVMRELEFRLERRFFQVALGTMDQGLTMIEADGRVSIINARAAELLELPADLVESRPHFSDLISYQREQGEFVRTEGELRQDIDKGIIRPTRYNYERTRPDGTVLEVRTVPVPGGGMVRTFTDITTMRAAEAAVRSSEERLQHALRASRMIAWERDLRTGRTSRSGNADEMLKIDSGHFSQFVERLHPDDQATMDRLVETAASRSGETIEVRYRVPGGREIWLGIRAELPSPDRMIGITFDITDRKAAEEEIWRTANHDALTGLPNRAFFAKRLNEALDSAEADGTTVSLLIIDLDEFKDVNDLLGHDAGDALLRETADRLKAMARPCDMVARIGGDEFAIIIVEPFTLENAARFAELLVDELRAPFDYEGRALSTRASIGVAAFPDHHRDAVELMKDADIALYRAKAEGRTRAVIYSESAREATQQRVRIAQEVRHGLARDEFVPFYQPKIDLQSGRIDGFEALARWQSPMNGLLTPAYFGSAFADAEIAVKIGDKMIRRIAADLRSWLDLGLECGRVAVNMSSAEFADPHVAQRILQVFDEHRVPTNRLEIEVTESVFLGRCPETVLKTLRSFHERGVRIALDDFGTGFASLTHLKQFPVDHIKVDQSFVRDLTTDKGDAAIVGAVIGLGKSLGMEVTAEGVETTEQVQRLQALGCNYAQGYLYAKPMIGSRVPSFIRSWKSDGRGALEMPVPKLGKVKKQGSALRPMSNSA
jgi:diguanylate cyclase (GGDEF)-like protein